ncbi:hypothetical protein ABID21_001794 [Pseudorhizobium tarimense]|uniref:Uncharacterized protein n=1 Tax=Pseudorhizobium tarimense TaxID=1079109 RepID=A0ABV2H563_9HYPH
MGRPWEALERNHRDESMSSSPSYVRWMTDSTAPCMELANSETAASWVVSVLGADAVDPSGRNQLAEGFFICRWPIDPQRLADSVPVGGTVPDLLSRPAVNVFNKAGARQKAIEACRSIGSRYTSLSR